MKLYRILTSSAALLTCVALSLAQDREKADSLVNMTWQETESRTRMTGSVEMLLPGKMEKDPVSDFRRRLTGQFMGLEIMEVNGDILPTGNLGYPYLGSNSIKTNSRGFTDIAVVVDDVPIPFNQYLFEPSQIESVTMITGVADKAAFGPIASNGVLYIKTRTGGYNTPLRITVDAETGVDFAGVWPQWVSGVEYAMLNNQARINSGYIPIYSMNDLAAYSMCDPDDVQHPNVDYKSLMMRSWKPLSRFSFGAAAGTERVRYNVTIAGVNDNDLVKVGPSSDFNKLNISSSVTAKINRYIEAIASFNGMIAARRGITDWAFSDYRKVPAIAYPLTLKLSEDSPFYDPDKMNVNGQIFGVSRTYPDNYYANALEGGFFTRFERSGMFNATLNVDMGWLLKGLKSRTFVNLATFYYSQPGKNEEYNAYYWNPVDIIDALSEHTGTKASGKSLQGSNAYESLNLFQRFSYGVRKNGHRLDAAGTFYINNSATSSSSNYQRQLYGVGDVKYSFKDRYVLDAVTEYAGSSRYRKGKRYAWFPAAGAAWVISNEPFMKKASQSWLDMMKIRVQAGLIGDADVYNPEVDLWQGIYVSDTKITYGPYSAGQWFGDRTITREATTETRIANHDLTWTTLFQTDAGADLSVFGMLDLSFNWYRIDKQGIIAEMGKYFSDTFGYSSSKFYQNYESKLYHGWEGSVRFHRDWKDWGFEISGNVMNWEIIRTKLASRSYYDDEQSLKWKPEGSITGWRCIGKFTSEEEIESSAVYSTGTQIGDLKYADLNGDGQIGNSDREIFGNSNPRYRYAVNLGARIKSFEISLTGTGQADFLTALTNEYFWNGWGDGNYSSFVMENIGGKYPRLGYDKSNSNFIESDFWYCRGDWFKIQSAEVAWNASLKKGSHLKGLRFSLRGANLATFTEVPYVDPEATDSGVSAMPLFRTVTIGVKATF